MPGINSTSPRYEGWDTEYDHYQHYFYDDHDPDEDFFKSTAPSEDIWKKFELVPTPPMSPIRTLEGAARVGLVYPSLGDKLEWVSQFLGQDEEQDFPCKLSPAEETLGNLSSIIIQDCMWSGFSAGQQLEKVVADRIASCPPAPGPTKLALQTTGAGVVSAGRSQCVPADNPALNGAPADCVDPTAVLTFPLSGCYKKQVSSGSESHTDSSDDDDDDDDEDDDDEEEIDVVTVDQQQRRKRPRRRRLGGVARRRRQPVTITVRADPLDPCAKRFHISIHQQQHNYAAPSPDAMATPPPPATATTAAEPPRKRARHDGGADGADHPDSHPHPAAALPRLGHAPQDFDGGRPESPGSGSDDDDDSSSSSSASSSPAGSPRASSPGPAHHHPLKPRPQQPPPSHPGSPQSSDGEDTDRRRTHNFLERKRRNDLRSRFLALRDEIPGLAECPKTPKVAILTQATEYLRQLHAGERQRAQERRQLRARQQQLLRRLAQLKRS